MLKTASAQPQRTGWVGGLTTKFIKNKNKIHCSKYNKGVQTWSSSKTTLPPEHERVFLHTHSTKVAKPNATANSISALPLSSLVISTIGPEKQSSGRK